MDGTNDVVIVNDEERSTIQLRKDFMMDRLIVGMFRVGLLETAIVLRAKCDDVLSTRKEFRSVESFFRDPSNSRKLFLESWTRNPKLDTNMS